MAVYQLVSPPARLRTNLLLNPSFEVNISDGGWTSFFGTTTVTRQAQPSSLPQCGSFCARLAQNSGSNIDIRNSNLRFAASPGQVFSAGVYVQPATTARNVTAFVDFYNVGGTRTALVNGTATAEAAAGTWTRVIVEGATAPATTTQANVIFQASGVGAAEQHFMDGAIAVQAATLPTYFDGMTPYGSWDGTAHNSTSGLYPNVDFITRIGALDTIADLSTSANGAGTQFTVPDSYIGYVDEAFVRSGALVRIS